MKALRHLHAWLGGYFWLPCPVCGRLFGGHEKPRGRVLTAKGRAVTTCSGCLGEWVVVNGQTVRLEHDFDDDGALTPLYIAISSDWPSEPLPPSPYWQEVTG